MVRSSIVFSFFVLLIPRIDSTTLLPLCNILNFGAVGDNRTEDTAAFALAIASCSIVTLPSPYSFLIRPVKLDAHDNLTLIIEKGATLVGWSDIDTWNASDGGIMRALLWSDAHRNCSSISKANILRYKDDLCIAPLVGLSIIGGGTIDGQGWRWWKFLKTRSRPMLINLVNAQNLFVSNVTLIDSPSFHLQVRGSDIEIEHVTIKAGNCTGWFQAPNTDGLNIGGQRIYVHDSYIHNGDDCVPTNVGVNGEDTVDVLVERVVCECGTNGGVPIIAGNGTVRNVVYKDMIVRGTNQGAGAKISEIYDTPTGNFINITWQNISIENPRYAALYANMFQEDTSPHQCLVPNNSSHPLNWLSAHNFTFKDISITINSTTGSYSGCFVCSNTSRCTGFVFDNVQVSDVGQPPIQFEYICGNVDYSSFGSVPTPCQS